MAYRLLLVTGLLLCSLAARAEEPAWTVGTAEASEKAAVAPTGVSAAAAVVKLAKAPTVDGNLAEWADTVLHVSFPFADLQDRRAARLRFAYDDAALYLAGRVTDDTPLANAHDASSGAEAASGDALRLAVDAGRPTVVTLFFSTPRQAAVVLASDPAYRAFTDLAASGAKAVLLPDKDGKGYTFEAKVPWAALGGKPGSPNARLAWEIRWGDRTGSLTTLVYADGLSRAITGGRDALATPALWGAVKWLTPAQAREQGKPVAFSLPQIKYTVPSNAYVTVVIEDAQGRRVRNLVSEGARLKGERREVWDGRDDRNQLVAPGSYKWRGLHHPGLSPEYLMSFNNPGSPPFTTDNASSWGADHDAPVAVNSAGGRMLLAWNNCEAGSSLICTDLTGKKQWGWRSDPSLPWDTTAMAATDKYVVLAKSGWAWVNREDHGVALARFDAATGSYANWPQENGGVGNGTLRVRPFEKEAPGSEHRLTGLSVGGGVLYLSFFRENLIEMRDLESGQVLGSFPMPTPRGSAVEPDGSLLVVSGKQLVRVHPQTRQLTALKDLDQPRQVACAPGGEIYVSDWGPMQVVVLDRAGKELRRVGRPGGRPTVGAWQADGLLRPEGMAVDPQNRLWVAEHDWWPKRFSVWAAAGKLAKDFIGPTPYGCVTSYLDPDDHTIGYSSGTKFKLDYATKTYTPLAVLGRNDGPGRVFWWAEAGKFYTVKGKRYFVGEGGAFTFKTIFLTLPDRLQAVSALGSARQLRDAYIGPEIPALTAAKDYDWFSWADQNGDALLQGSELQIVTSPSNSPLGTYWGGWTDPELAWYWPAWNGNLYAFPVTGWTACGAPIHDLTQSRVFAKTLGGDIGFLGTDSSGRVLGRGYPVMAWRKDGTVDWTYPSEFAMHGRPGPPAPGRIVEVHRITGIAALPPAVGGELYAMNGNDGEWYFLTTDGLFVGRVFKDFRVGGHRAPEYLISQEAFGGVFLQASDDGKYYVIAGHTDVRVFRLDGVEGIKRIAGGAVDLSGGAYTAAQQVLSQETFAEKTSQSARVPRLAAAPGADGFPAAWPEGAQLDWTALNGATVRVKKAWDQAALYLRYEVTDATPLKNNGEDWKLLFKYGDSVDFQLATDPAADPKRATAAAGDLRLLLALAKGKPMAVLYQPVVPGAVGEKVPFSSPWRTFTFDRVRPVTDAVKLRFTPQAPWGYVDVAVPWSVLGYTPQPGARLRGDFGALFGNEAGELTMLRSYWSNQNTSVVSDVPSEAALEPRQWGDLVFE